MVTQDFVLSECKKSLASDLLGLPAPRRNENMRESMSLTALFPDFYSHWLAQRLPGRLHESLATCDRCAMVSPSGVTRDAGPFDPTLKCCTYFPFVANFSLGTMLAKNAEDVRTRLAASSSRGVLLPLGLFALPEHEALIQALGPEKFGRDRRLLCPFYDSVSCGCSVWANRPAVCTTYFCQSSFNGLDGLDGLDRLDGSQERKGFEFWADVETYLNQFEWAVANEVLGRLGFTDDELENCEAVMLTEEPGPERDWCVRAAWAEWFGREEELLHLCTEKAHELTPADVDRLLGDEMLDLEERLRAFVAQNGVAPQG